MMPNFKCQLEWIERYPQNRKKTKEEKQHQFLFWWLIFQTVSDHESSNLINWLIFLMDSWLSGTILRWKSDTMWLKVLTLHLALASSCIPEFFCYLVNMMLNELVLHTPLQHDELSLLKPLTNINCYSHYFW